jgi:hypothetical protein
MLILVLLLSLLLQRYHTVNLPGNLDSTVFSQLICEFIYPSGGFKNDVQVEISKRKSSKLRRFEQ